MTSNHYFISYSSVDGRDFALKLHVTLVAAPYYFPVWIDKRDLKPGTDWDTQISEAIRNCDGLIFVMTHDSVQENSVCKLEWSSALRYKKPVVPLYVGSSLSIPFRLTNRHYIDFRKDFDAAITHLQNHLIWLKSPAGTLQRLKDRLIDAARDLRRTDDESTKKRIEEEIVQLTNQISEQEAITSDPEAAIRRTKEAVERGIEVERSSVASTARPQTVKVINPPPAIIPDHFQDRFVEMQILADFLKSGGKRLAFIAGPGGTGKTAMVCQLLQTLEECKLPYDLGDIALDAIIYLGNANSRVVSIANLYADLCKLLPKEKAEQLNKLYRSPEVSVAAKIRALLREFTRGCVVVLLDNLEDKTRPLDDRKSVVITDDDLSAALQIILTEPQHTIKVIVTTRVIPTDLLKVQPASQEIVNLDSGLSSPYAEEILRQMDKDGRLGVRDAPATLLDAAREYTRGYPRALEALIAVLRSDRSTTLSEILKTVGDEMPDDVVDVLVGEAFSRLDSTDQMVLQTLAIYRRPVTATAVDFLLQPYIPGINSAPIISRLVGMYLVRTEVGRFFLHPIDRTYALARIERGEDSDRQETGEPKFKKLALFHKASQYFRKLHPPQDTWKKLEDIYTLLAEFDMLCEGEEWTEAARVLLSIDYDYLTRWGDYKHVINLHERIRSEISDIALKQECLQNLGLAYRRTGKVSNALEVYNQALIVAQEVQSPIYEAESLDSLGRCYSDIGQTVRSIDFHQRGLMVAQQCHYKRGQGNCLNNLGNLLAGFGNSKEAIESYKKALEIRCDIGDRAGESATLCNLSEVYSDVEQYVKAIEYARSSLMIANDQDITDAYGHYNLGLAYFFLHDFWTARRELEIAKEISEERIDNAVHALLGIIILCQGDRDAAHMSFTMAIFKANQMLVNNPQDYWALDAKVLALCGLAICGENLTYTTEAITTFLEARTINNDTGNVKRIRRLISSLAGIDGQHLLDSLHSFLRNRYG